jgi:cytochrome P450
VHDSVRALRRPDDFEIDADPYPARKRRRDEASSPVRARHVTTDVEHRGRNVPGGGAIMILNGSADRDDERQFAGPDRFEVTRKTGRHLSFGYGVRFCLGAHLARLGTRTALDEVLQRFPVRIP